MMKIGKETKAFGVCWNFRHMANLLRNRRDGAFRRARRWKDPENPDVTNGQDTWRMCR